MSEPFRVVLTIDDPDLGEDRLGGTFDDEATALRMAAMLLDDDMTSVGISYPDEIGKVRPVVRLV